MVTKLLIANRAEIACRIARTAHAMGIATVAVFSEPDRSAPHVASCDEAVALGGASAAESYLRIDALLDAAARTGADAVHPGYGFLAENPAFAQACVDAGLTFVGPTPEVIAAMGDKLRAKETMRSAGVPVLEQWVVEDPAALDAERMPYPVLVKAAAGGGGKGMRIVERAADLTDAVAAAQREAKGAFGDERVFIEPYLSRPRHIEVQIIGDTHGTVLHLGERECSVQRRYQKVIEEAPSPMVDDELRKQLTSAAVAAGEALGYTNAGTVEFIANAEGAFFFLEVNTRLQVEHPVTELAWALNDGRSLDLVRLQLLVARGERLGFGQTDLVAAGHAIEVRLYAEDPANGFLPATGRLDVWEPARPPGVRVDDGVAAGNTISVHYDPMLAKVIGVAPTRTEAATVLARALEHSRIHGTITNRDFLVDVLRHPAFLDAALHTGFIDEHFPQGWSSSDKPGRLQLHALAAALDGARRRRRSQRILTTVPSGWRNNRSQPQRVVFDIAGRDEPVDVGYWRRRDGTWAVTVDEQELGVRVLAWPDQHPRGCLDVEVDGLRRRVTVTPVADRVHVDSVLGHTSMNVRPRFPVPGEDEVAGGLTAPMPGTVVSVPAAEGARVAKGELLVILEAMKMEHRIVAPYDGTVSEVRVSDGQTVDADDVLVVLADD